MRAQIVIEVPKDSFYDSELFQMENYSKFRPPYTSVFYKEIFDMFKKGRNEWRSALDIGTGPGMVARELATKFGTVYGVDSNQRYIDVAKAQSVDIPNVEFLQAKAENLSVFPDNSFDLVTVSEAAHWFDPEAFEEIGRVLKPNGLLVMWIYAKPFFPDNEQADKLITDIWLRYNVECFEYSERLDRTMQLVTSGFDKIAIPDRYFKAGTVRLKVNYDQTINTDNFPCVLDLGVTVPEADVIVKRIDRDYLTVNEGAEFIEGYMDHLVPLDHLNLREIFKHEYSMLDRVLEGLRTKISWPCNVVFATKRDKLDD